MLQLRAMKLPPTGNDWTDRPLIDDAFDAYLEWRDASAEVWHAYQRWNGAPAREAARKFWAYRAALYREEHAARVYGRLVSRLEAETRERAETRRRFTPSAVALVTGVFGPHHPPRAMSARAELRGESGRSARTRTGRPQTVAEAHMHRTLDTAGTPVQTPA
jgi:hypothetical protein